MRKKTYIGMGRRDICIGDMREEIASIDFGDPEEKLPPSMTPEGQALIKEVTEVMEQSRTLKREATQLAEEILAFDKRVDDIDVLTSTYEEKESVMEDIERLTGRLRREVGKLKKLEKDHETVRRKVNNYYGKEVMKKFQRSAEMEEIFEDLLSGEEWRG